MGWQTQTRPSAETHAGIPEAELANVQIAAGGQIGKQPLVGDQFYYQSLTRLKATKDWILTDAPSSTFNITSWSGNSLKVGDYTLSGCGVFQTGGSVKSKNLADGAKTLIVTEKFTVLPN